MTIDEFNALVAEARAAHPTWFDLPSDEPPDESTLSQLEDELGVSLPSDYRWFLQQYGGGDFAFASIYSGDNGSDLLITRNQPTADRQFVAVSDDGTGNFFGFPVVDGTCEDQMMVLDHESGELRETGYGPFLEFVARVGLQAA